MYLRFTTMEIDEDSGKPQGIFSAAYALLYGGELSKDEWLALRAILDWYEKYLPAPPKSFTTSRAIFWFRGSAEENINRMWEMAHLLREHGRHITVYKCRLLANIIYSDALQVAAFPSERDGKVMKQ